MANPVEYLDRVIDASGFAVDEVVSGTAKGADSAGERWAEQVGLPVERFPADWDTHGKSAGPKRNQEMAEYADKAVVLWNGESRGSEDMIESARDELGEENVHVHRYRDEEPGGDDRDSDDDDDGPVDPTMRRSLDTIDGLGEKMTEALQLAGLTTAADVDEAGVNGLQGIDGIGPRRAETFHTQARALVEAYEAALAEKRDQVSPTHDSTGTVGRIAVVIGEETFDKTQGQQARNAVDTALEMSGVSVGEDLTLGFVEDTSDLSREPVGDMGGNAVAGFVEFQQNMGTLVDRHAFPTPWEKYEPIFDWYDRSTTVFDDTDKPMRPDEAPPLHEIPFDTPRGYQDVQPGWPAKERNQALVAWAKHVVIIDGEYVEGIIQECEHHKVSYDHYEARMTGDDVTVTQKQSLEEETPTVTDIEAITKDPEDADDDPVPVYSPTADKESQKPNAERDPGDYDWDNSPVRKGSRAGSPDDMETDEALEEGVQARDEHWPESEHHDGKGIGSNSDRTGEYPDAHL